jgi:hypothetical protein
MLDFESAKELLNQLVSQTVGVHAARFERDIRGPLSPLYDRRDQLYAHRATENRIFACLERIGAERGFETRYDDELDAQLAAAGCSPHVRQKVQHRMERGYLVRAGRPGEGGGDTLPIDFAADVLRKLGQPISVEGIDAVLHLHSKLEADALDRSASLYDQARSDQFSALASMQQLREAKCIPHSGRAWGAPGFAEADATENGDFDVVEGEDRVVLTRPAHVSACPGGKLDGAASSEPVGPAPAATNSPDVPPGPPALPALVPSTLSNGGRIQPTVHAVGEGKHRVLIQPAADPGRSFMALVERLIETNSGWAKETKRQHRSLAHLLALTVGSDDMTLMKQHHIGTYVTNLAKLLKSHGKSSKDQHRSLEEMLALAAAVRNRTERRRSA